MPATLPAPVRHAAAKATLQFDWLVPDKPFLRVAEVATALGMKTTFVEEFFADRCHRYGERSDQRSAISIRPATAERARPPMRIPRAFVIAELAASAKYEADTKLQAVASTFREFGLAELHELSRQLAEQIRRKS